MSRKPPLESAAQSDGPGQPLPVAKHVEPPGPPPPRRGAARDEPPAGPDIERADEADAGFWRRLLSPRSMASFLVSFGFHVVLIVVLSLIVAMLPARASRTLVVTTEPSDGVSASDLEDARVIMTDTATAESSSTLVPLDTRSELQLPIDRLLRGDAKKPTLPSTTPGRARSDALLRSSSASGGGLQARRGDLKARLLDTEGGTPESEAAVALGLAWLAAHQWQDGGWRLDLSEGPCGGKCRNSGKVATSTGATALALLPFLGAGHTHLSGDYRDVVHNGLYYLKSRIIKTPHGADLQEGTMYAQGLAAIVLCEAYAMTQDETLREPAQQAIDFICYAQHSGGGWRYYPGAPGDTTVFGWQMMALKSASMAGLDVPSPVITLGERFLDSVQSANGAYYGYLIRGKNPGPTAVGLLIRMYTGWHRDDPRLVRGVEFLAAQKPAPRDMYFNYYATQVVHHFGGDMWPKWNETMREYLIETQAATGHERGSWFFVDQHGSQGGRLYTTAICTMILEVYYRHMPLYEDRAVRSDWW